MTGLAVVEADLSESEARELAGRIRQLTAVTWTAVVKLYKGRGWLALGYGSWDECCDAEFDGARIKLPREERQEIVRSLADEGMSTRAIAAATGVSKDTVSRAIRSPVSPDTRAPSRAGDSEWRRDEIAAPSDVSGVEQRPVDGAVAAHAVASADLDDDEIVDAEIVAETPAPERRKVEGIDGKSYTLTPKPEPTPEEQREIDRCEADARTARNVQKVISSWPYIVDLDINPRREQILARLPQPDLDQLELIEKRIR